MFRSTRIPILGFAVALAAASGAVILAAPAHAAAGCQVTYTKTNEWTTSPGQGGFGANITVQNLGDPLTSWTLRFSFPGSQQVTLPGWGAVWSQAGPAVTAPNQSWNGNLGTGASTQIGFNGTWSGSNPDPTSFSLNNVTCTGSTTPPGNQPPRLSITSPSPGATFNAPATITVSATATDPDGTVARVDFSLGSLTASDTTSPYSTTFSNVAAGTYAVSARATDNQGATAVQDPFMITVGG
jgi:hypothetical protein